MSTEENRDSDSLNGRDRPLSESFMPVVRYGLGQLTDEMLQRLYRRLLANDPLIDYSGALVTPSGRY